MTLPFEEVTWTADGRESWKESAKHWKWWSDP